MSEKVINFKTDYVEGEPVPFTGTKMVAVLKPKYCDVFLCFKAENGNIPFAQIKLHGRLWEQKEACFESACEIAKEIEFLWNQKYLQEQEA